MFVQSATLLLLGLLPCILATGYDRQTLIDSGSYSVAEQLEVSQAFDQIDKLLQSGGALEGPLRQKLLVIAETIDESGQDIEGINDAADILDSLDQVVHWCDLDGYQALLRAYLSASTKSDSPEASSPTGKLVIEALQGHGQACRAQYSRKFSLVERDMEPAERVLAGKVDKLLSGDLLALLFPGDDLKARVRSTDIVDRFVAHVPRSLLMGKLNEAARRTADRVAINKDLSQRDASRHLIEPCKSYVENYADVFLPARLDLVLDEDKIKQINPTREPKFNEAWTRFRVCSALANLAEEQTLELVNKKLS